MWYRLAIKDEEAWLHTPEEFLQHHYTGYIDSDAYQGYRKPEGLERFVYKDAYPFEHGEYQGRDRTYQIRRYERPKQIAKWGPAKVKLYSGEVVDTEDIMRDEKGNAIYLTPEEMDEQGYDRFSYGLAAFDGDTPVGFASNEYGSTGVWVVDDHQKQGLGTHLLSEFRKLNPKLKNLGQMTSSGRALTKAYHRKLVQRALEEGKPVPQRVLDALGLSASASSV